MFGLFRPPCPGRQKPLKMAAGDAQIIESNVAEYLNPMSQRNPIIDQDIDRVRNKGIAEECPGAGGAVFTLDTPPQIGKSEAITSTLSAIIEVKRGAS